VGCGTASYVPGLLAQFPHLHYVGIEPIAQSFAAAEKTLQAVPQATVHFGLAYDALADYEPASFDLVLSLSVLEHVKRLPEFVAFCDRYLVAGGLMVHRYDLGHALAPHSWKEWLHVQLGNRVPRVLPETRFVRYVPESEVRLIYTQQGITPYQTTYHQMPNHKAIEKYLPADSTAVAELFAWEMSHQAEFAALATDTKERLFPAIAVWGRKS